MTAHIVELYHRIVATPRPNARRGLRRRKDVGAVTHHVVLYQCTVTPYRHNAVAGNFFYQVIPHHGMQTGVPVVPTVVCTPYHGITRTTQDVAIFYRQTVETRGYPVASVGNEDAATSAFRFHQRAIDVTHGNGVDPYAVRRAIVRTFYLQATSSRHAFFARIDNLQVPNGHVVRVINTHRVTRSVTSHNARLAVSLAISIYDDATCRRAFPGNFKLPIKSPAAFQQELVAGFEDQAVRFVQALPCLLSTGSGMGVVAGYGVHVISPAAACVAGNKCQQCNERGTNEAKWLSIKRIFHK